VARWLKKLAFTNPGNLCMQELGEFAGAGVGHTGKGKAIDLSVFKSQLPATEGLSGLVTPDGVRDILFPANGSKGFHTRGQQVVQGLTAAPAIHR
jgi:hypothetical protein